MEVVAVLSPILVAVSIGSLAAATARVVRHRSTDGLSLNATVLGVMLNIGWMAYGADNGDPIQFFNNIPSVVGAAMILAVAHKTGALTRRRIPVVATIAFTLLTVVATMTIGAVALAVILAVLTVTNRLPQVWESWKSPGGEGLSVPSFVLAVVSAAGWVLYGVLQGQIAVAASGAYGVATWSFILMRTLQAREPISIREEHVEAMATTRQMPALQVA